MSKQSVVALYETFAQAHDAVNALETAGVLSSDISVVANDSHGALADEFARRTDPAETARAEAGGKGTTVGLVAGGALGFLTGIGAIALPGVGPVIAVGTLASTLIGAGVGGLVGGLTGLLTGIGVPERRAQIYADAVRRGGTLVAITGDHDRAALSAILRRFKPSDLEVIAADAPSAADRAAAGVELNRKADVRATGSSAAGSAEGQPSGKR